MFGTHQRITGYENICNHQEKSQSIETDPEMTQIMELVDKDIQITPHIFRKVEKSMSVMSKMKI